MPRTRLLLPLSAAWFAVVLLGYHGLLGDSGFPPGNLPSLLLDALLLAGLGFAAWGAGSLIMGFIDPPGGGRSVDPREAFGAGLGAVALATLLLAMTHLLYRPVVVAMMVGLLAVAVAIASTMASHRLRRPARVEVDAPPASWDTGAVRAGLLVGGVATLAAALAPPEFYDALIYHLAVPAVYVREHAMTAIPGNYYASFPANMGMLYAVGLLLRGAELAQGIHWLCGAAAAAALHGIASRHFDRPTALVATALFALTPGVLLVSTWAIADLAVTLFATLCFGALVDYWLGGNRRRLVAAGVFAGLAMGTKYTAALMVVAPATVLLALRPPAGGRPAGWSVTRLRRAAGDIASFGLIAAVTLSPWLVRNTIISGNPLAPYFSGATEGTVSGGTGSPAISDELARRLPKDGGVPGLIVHYLRAPWSVTMERLGAGGYLLPAFLMLIPPLAFMRGLPRGVAPIVLLAATGLAAWAVSTQVTRYLMPVLPLAAILAALAARKLPRRIAAPVVGWCLLYGLFLYMFLAETIGTHRVVTGAETREEYLSRRVSYYPAARFLDTLGPEARVLFIGEGRTYYCPRVCIAATPFDRPAIDRYGEATGSALIDALRRDGVTHLLISDPELRRAHATTAAEFLRQRFPGGGLIPRFDRSGVLVFEVPGVPGVGPT